MKKAIIGSLAAFSLATFGTITNARSAHAANLNGSLTINGNMTASYNAATDKVFIDFTDVDDILGTGDFSAPLAGFAPNLDPGPNDNNTLPFDDPADGPGGAIINIKDLTLTKLPTPLPVYGTGAVASFLNFGERTLDGITGNLTFDLSSTDFIVSLFNNQVISDVAWPGAVGVWKFNGNTIALGSISGTQVPGAGSYTISLIAQSVPEPASMLGLGLVGGSIVLFRRRKVAQNQ